MWTDNVSDTTNGGSCAKKPPCSDTHDTLSYIIKDDSCLCPPSGPVETTVVSANGDKGCLEPCGANKVRTTNSHLCECDSSTHEEIGGSCVALCGTPSNESSTRDTVTNICICDTGYDRITTGCVAACDTNLYEKGSNIRNSSGKCECLNTHVRYGSA